MQLQNSELARRDSFYRCCFFLFFFGPCFILQGVGSSWMTTKQAAVPGPLQLRQLGGFISTPSSVSSARPRHSPTPPLSHPPRPPFCSPHQFIKPVTRLSLQSESERAPWQRTRGKSTGIKFQRNCLLNCGPQLLKFHPRFCVTAAVMNSVWL